MDSDDKKISELTIGTPVLTDLMPYVSNPTTSPETKASYVGNVYLEGWSPVVLTWTYASATTITVASGASSLYQKGDKVRFKQGGGYKYGYLVTVADTLLTFFGGSDYSVANSAITDVAISRVENPFGFPLQFNWAASITNLTQGNGVLTAKCKMNGSLVTGRVEFVFGSTSSMGSVPTLVLPITVATYGAITPIGISRMKDATGGNAATGGILTNGIFIVYNGSGTYDVGDTLSSTVPFTWAVSDQLSASFSYFA